MHTNSKLYNFQKGMVKYVFTCKIQSFTKIKQEINQKRKNVEFMYSTCYNKNDRETK